MRIVVIDLKHPMKLSVPVCACIGFFDGLHKGHQALVSKTVEAAKVNNCESALITFDPDPWVTIKGLEEEKLEHITIQHQKINLAVKHGIENIIVLKFTKEMCELSPKDFIKYVLDACNLKALICGFDFHYGFKGEGDCESLKRDADFDVIIVDPVIEDGQKISSSRITLLLNAGKLEDANRLLGYNFEMVGKVIPGRHKGRQFGFPTANIAFPKEYLHMRQGVYAGYATVRGERYKAMINIGHNPTMNYTRALSYEVHIIDFEGDIYGERIIVEYVKYLRPEMKFQNLNNLIMQLEQDRYTCKRYLP